MADQNLTATYDPAVDALHVRTRAGAFATNERLDERVILDLDDEGNVLGIEVLRVLSRGVGDLDHLADRAAVRPADLRKAIGEEIASGAAA